MPDVEAVADQLIGNYRSATLSVGGPEADPSDESVIEGDVDAINTRRRGLRKLKSRAATGARTTGSRWRSC